MDFIESGDLREHMYRKMNRSTSNLADDSRKETVTTLSLTTSTDGSNSYGESEYTFPEDKVQMVIYVILQAKIRNR